MDSTKTLILSHQQIAKTVTRMAYEIVERNYDEQSIVLAGLADRGYMLTQLLFKEIEKISGDITVEVCEIKIQEANPTTANVEFSPTIANFENKVLVIVDDVANSGKTLFYGMQPFVKHNPRKIQTAVLVDRDHRTIPFNADYVGLSLSTTLQEHISVELGKKNAVYLS